MEVLHDMASYLFSDTVVSKYDYVVQLSGRCAHIGQLWREIYPTPDGVIFTTEFEIFNYVQDIAQSHIQLGRRPAQILIEDVAMFHGCRVYDLVELLIGEIANIIGPHLTQEEFKYQRDFILQYIDIRIFMARSNAPLLMKADTVSRIRAKKSLNLLEMREMLSEVDNEFYYSNCDLANWKTFFPELEEAEIDIIVQIWNVVYLAAVDNVIMLSEKQRKRGCFMRNLKRSRSNPAFRGSVWDDSRDLMVNMRTVSLDLLYKECCSGLGGTYDFDYLFDTAITCLADCRKIFWGYDEYGIKEDRIVLNDATLTIPLCLLEIDKWDWFEQLVCYCRSQGLSIRSEMTKRGYIEAKLLAEEKVLGEVAERLDTNHCITDETLLYRTCF